MNVATIVLLEEAAWKQTINSYSSATETYHAILWQYACRYQMLLDAKTRLLEMMSGFINAKIDNDKIRAQVESDMKWYDAQLKCWEEVFAKTLQDFRDLSL